MFHIHKTYALVSCNERANSIIRITVEEEVVTYTIIQSITSSEMCSLYLTHPSAHTHTHTHTHLEQWAADAVAPREQSGFSALLKGLISLVDNSCRSWDSNPQPQVTSPMLYPLKPRLPEILAIKKKNKSYRCWVEKT